MRPMSIEDSIKENQYAAQKTANNRAAVCQQAASTRGTFSPGEKVRYQIHKDIWQHGEVVEELPECGGTRIYRVRDVNGPVRKLTACKLARLRGGR